MRYSFCKAGDRKAGNAGSGAEWGREPGSNLDIAENRGALRTYRELGLDTGSAAETWMEIVLLDLLKLGITLVARSAKRPIEDGARRRSL